MAEKLSIEELVRRKLGNAEIDPSSGAWKAVERRLRMQRFLRFDPSRFNAWYLGALLVTGGLVSGLLLTGGGEEPTLETPAEVRQAEGESAVQENRSEPAGPSGPVITEGTPGEISGHSGSPAESPQTGVKETTADSPPADVPAAPAADEADLSEPVPAGESPAQRTVHRTLVTYFTPSVQSGCAPLTVQLINTSANATGYRWSFGDGRGSEEANPEVTFTEPGTYTVTLDASGDGDQRSAFHQLIRVHPAPQAAFEIQRGLEGLDGSPALELINYSSGAATYQWSVEGAGWTTGEFQPVIPVDALPEGAREVRLVALSQEGCTDTAAALLPPADEDKKTMRFPTAFSPTGTGPTGGSYSPNQRTAEVFHPFFIEEPSEYHLQIFNRLGELIFESRDVYIGWDGYYQQERAAMGVYLWIARGKWLDGTPFSKKGDVTLLWTHRP